MVLGSTTVFAYETGGGIRLIAGGDTDEVSGIVNENDPALGYGRCYGQAIAFDGVWFLGMFPVD